MYGWTARSSRALDDPPAPELSAHGTSARLVADHPHHERVARGSRGAGTEQFQPIGVDDHRDRDLGRKASHQRAHLGAGGKPRPERPGAHVRARQVSRQGLEAAGGGVAVG